MKWSENQQQQKNQFPIFYKLARWVLKRIIDRDISYAAMGDFDEIYAVKIKKSGTLNAAAWYWLQVIKSFPAFVRDSAQ